MSGSAAGEETGAGQSAGEPGARAAVLFDLDGTLLDPAGAITETMAEAIEARGHPRPDEQTLRRFVGPPAETSLRELTAIPLPEHAAILADYRAAYPARARRDSRLYPGIRPLLDRLSADPDVVLAVATQKPLPTARLILEAFDLTDCFDVVCGARDARDERCRSLPDDKPGIIALALHQLQESGPLERSRSMMVGDRVYDVEGARSNGLPCAGVAWGFGGQDELRRAGAQWIVEDSGQLCELIERHLHLSRHRGLHRAT